MGENQLDSFYWILLKLNLHYNYLMFNINSMHLIFLMVHHCIFNFPICCIIIVHLNVVASLRVKSLFLFCNYTIRLCSFMFSYCIVSIFAKFPTDVLVRQCYCLICQWWWNSGRCWKCSTLPTFLGWWHFRLDTISFIVILIKSIHYFWNTRNKIWCIDLFWQFLHWHNQHNMFLQHVPQKEKVCLVVIHKALT